MFPIRHRTQAPPRWPFAPNWASPFLSRCSALFVAADGAMVDLTRNAPGTRSGAGVDVAPSPDGLNWRELQNTGANHWAPASTTGALVDTDSPLTVAFICKLATGGDSYPTIVNLQTTGSISPMLVQIGRAGDAYDGLNWGGNAAPIQIDPVPGVSAVTDRMFGAVAYTGGTFSTASNHRGMVNGVSGTPAVGGAFGGHNNVNYVGSGTYASNQWNGHIGCVLVAQRAWSLEEMRAWYDPATRWSWAEEYGRRTYFVPAAAPGGARPQGPLGHPLHGPLAGPIGP